MIDLQLNSSETVRKYRLGVKDVASRLSIATSTLNTWLKEDEDREAKHQCLKFHRWVGNRRKWSEQGYQLLELAVHAQSENGVLSSSRLRAKSATSPADPDAEASLAEVLGPKRTRTF